MLSSFLFSAILSFAGPCGHSACSFPGARSVSTQISISFSIQAINAITMDVEEVFPNSHAYRVTLTKLSSGVEKPVNVEKRFLVFDGRKDTSEDLIVCDFSNDNLDIFVPNNVVAINWSVRSEKAIAKK